MSGFIALFLLYVRLDVTLDHLLDETSSTTGWSSEIVLEGVGFFSAVISFISLHKSLIIN